MGQPREAVIKAFNQYYADMYSSTSSACDRFMINLKAGVELAIGFTNPKQAIPSNYTGDGSFWTEYQTTAGIRVIQKEFIPIERLNSKMPYYAILRESSQPFKTAHELFYLDRVALEAHHKVSRARENYLSVDDAKTFELAEVDLRTRSEIRFPLSDDSRADVVDAFNQYYARLYMQRDWNDKYAVLFNTLNTGVELATGRKVSDPSKAITSDYQGDGSFLRTRFQTRGGIWVVQTEAIPLENLGEEGSVDKILQANSRRFWDSRPWVYRHPRVELEAFLISTRTPGIADDMRNFHEALWCLGSRRELVLPAA